MRIDDLIGTPYRLGARGPDAYDCAGLVVECLRRMGIVMDIPDTSESEKRNYTSMHAILRKAWRPVKESRAGLVVLIKPAHVGMMVNRREMIHCSEWRGQVCIEYIDSPHLRPCLGGFYEYAGTAS